MIMVMQSMSRYSTDTDRNPSHLLTKSKIYKMGNNIEIIQSD